MDAIAPPPIPLCPVHPRSLPVALPSKHLVAARQVGVNKCGYSRNNTLNLISSRITIPSFQRHGETFVLLVRNIPCRLFNVKVLLREQYFGSLVGLCGVKVFERLENYFSCHLLFSRICDRDSAFGKLAALQESWILTPLTEQVRFAQVPMRLGLNLASRPANDARRRRLIHNLDDWHSIYHCNNTLAQMKLSMILDNIKVFQKVFSSTRFVMFIRPLSEVFGQHRGALLRICMNLAEVFKKLRPKYWQRVNAHAEHRVFRRGRGHFFSRLSASISDKKNALIPYLHLRQRTIIQLQKCMVQHLPILSSLKSLIVTYFHSFKLMPRLLAGLSSCASLTKLNFSHNNLHSYHLRDVHLPNLKCLDLRHNQISSYSFLCRRFFKRYVNLQRQSYTLTDLFQTFFKNYSRLHSSCSEQITSLRSKFIEELKSHKCIRKARLRSVSRDVIELKSGGAQSLGRALQRLKALTKLDLGRNNFSDGCVHLAEALYHLNNLKSLSLNHNSLGSRGMRVLGPAIGSLQSLTYLNLAHNAVSSRGVPALCSALSRLPLLRSLFLENNSFTPDHAASICHSISFHCHLKVVLLLDSFTPVSSVTRSNTWKECKLDEPPYEILDRCKIWKDHDLKEVCFNFARLIQYLASEEKEPSRNIRIFLLGDSMSGKSSLAKSLRSPLSKCGSIPPDFRTIGIERSSMQLYKPRSHDKNSSTSAIMTPIRLSSLLSYRPVFQFHRPRTSGAADDDLVVGAFNPGSVLYVDSSGFNDKEQDSSKLRENRRLKVWSGHYNDLQNDSLNCIPNLFQEHDCKQSGYIDYHECDELLDSESAIDAHIWDLAGQNSYLLSHIMHFSSRSIYVITWKPEASATSVEEKFRKQLAPWLQALASKVPDASILLVGTHCESRCEGAFQSEFDNMFRKFEEHVSLFNERLFPLEVDHIFELMRSSKEQIEKKTKDYFENREQLLPSTQTSQPRPSSDVKSWRKVIQDSSLHPSLRNLAEDIVKKMSYLNALEDRMRLLLGIRDGSDIPAKTLKPQPVHMKVQYAKVDNLTGFGIYEMRGQLFDICNSMPFMKEKISKHWAAILSALHETKSPCRTVSKDYAISAVKRGLVSCTNSKNARNMDPQHVWSILKFYSDVGRIFIRDKIVVRDPSHLIDFLNPLIHHNPGSLLIETGPHQQRMIHLDSLKQHRARLDCQHHLDSLKRLDIFSTDFLKHLASWRELDKVQTQSLMFFFEESNIISQLESDKWLVTSRIQGRDTLSGIVEEVSTVAKYHALYLLQSAHPGIIAYILSQIIRLKSKYLTHKSGKDSLSLHRSVGECIRGDCVFSVEDRDEVLKSGLFSALSSERTIDHQFQYALRVSSTDYGLFQFASKISDEAMDSGQFGFRFNCYGTCGSFAFCATKVEPLHVYESLLCNLEKSSRDAIQLHRLTNHIEIYRAKELLGSLQGALNAFSPHCHPSDSATVANKREKKWINFRCADGKTDLTNGFCSDGKTDLTNGFCSDSLSVALHLPVTCAERKQFSLIIQPDFPVFVSHAWDDGSGEFLIRLKQHIEQQSSVSVFLDQHCVDQVQQDSLTNMMQKALKGSSVVFIALTPTYLTNPNCLSELCWALDLEQQGFLTSVKVMPLHPSMTYEKRKQLTNFGHVFSHKEEKIVKLSEFAIQQLKRLNDKLILLPFEKLEAWRSDSLKLDWKDCQGGIRLQKLVEDVLVDISCQKVGSSPARQPVFQVLDSAIICGQIIEEGDHRKISSDPNFMSLFPECTKTQNPPPNRNPSPPTAISGFLSSIGFVSPRLGICSRILDGIGLKCESDFLQFLKICREVSQSPSSPFFTIDDFPELNGHELDLINQHFNLRH